MDKRFIYEACERNGIQSHEIVVESEKSFLIKWQFNNEEWIVCKSDVSDNYIEGKRFSYDIKVAKQKLEKVIIPNLAKRLEAFKTQL